MPLAFPSSSHELGGFVEVVFRDGPRQVPDYLAELMADIDTVRYSYDEATEAVNGGLSKRVANDAFDRAIRNHFRGGR